MRAVVDRTTCSGHALCHSVAPGVYDLDEEGRALTAGEVPAHRATEARAGAAACPERAIAVVGD